ncbi:MAG: hypothetical protein M1815_005670 [Lichina confinis]|nr:MAG: hypothetical protein M1815_005670 [Lichina confinis]
MPPPTTEELVEDLTKLRISEAQEVARALEGEKRAFEQRTTASNHDGGANKHGDKDNEGATNNDERQRLLEEYSETTAKFLEAAELMFKAMRKLQSFLAEHAEH